MFFNWSRNTRASTEAQATFGIGAAHTITPTLILETRLNYDRPGRPNSSGQQAQLRDNWQDIGSNRFVQAAQNGLIESMSYFSNPAAFTQGNSGRNTFDRQRFIDTQFSASKEWKFRERFTTESRFDFQNPLKWFNLSAPNTVVNFTNPATFGKVSTSTSDEGTTANAGGQGLMNITLSFRF